MAGMMYHHFHDDTHPEGQGSLSAGEFRKIIEAVGNVLPAREYLDRARAGTLKPEHRCITFDDGLRCQYDVALPVLNDLGLTAFWFIYSSPHDGKLEKLELYRYFRTVAFPSVEAFYIAFDLAVVQSPYGDEMRAKMAGFDPKGYLAEYSFYTDGDRRFRYIRDVVLGPERYFKIMDRMILFSKLNTFELVEHLWIGPDETSALARAGHVIGLHSHTHPTKISALPLKEQEAEYRTNYRHLSRLAGPIIAMSHPNNSYAPETLGLLRDMGIVLGFRANPVLLDYSPLEMPRHDSADLRRLVS